MSKAGTSATKWIDPRTGALDPGLVRVFQFGMGRKNLRQRLSLGQQRVHRIVSAQRREKVHRHVLGNAYSEPRKKAREVIRPGNGDGDIADGIFEQ